jgi:Zn-dependent M28 family amino/carboxypeptidase
MAGRIARPLRRLTLLVLLVLSLALAVPVALADDINHTKAFRKAVTLAGIREHQQAWQTIANANGGTRASGTPGYDQSAQYVFDRLTAAGYNPSFQEFQFAFFQLLGASVVQQVLPNQATYASSTLTYSPPGDVTAPITAVDTDGTASDTRTSGCEADDFVDFPAGHIALVQRGPLSPPAPQCTFAQKALHAQTAGAVAVVVFNRGTPGNTGVVAGTLGAPGVAIPVVGINFADGQALYTLAQSGPVSVRVQTNTISEFRTTRNVLAETPGGDPNRVIVVGAHLDSVAAGPGINDNGSGSAAILEIAEVLALRERDLRNKLRFAWWGAEELNLLGSAFYVNSLTEVEQARIELNLNFDMLGSPNFVRFVYDGNGSAGGPSGPAGSGAIEQVFLDYFTSQGLATAPTPFNGRSDYGPFIAVGIPAGGLFSGAEGIKTAAQAEIYGGTAGQPYDPCYHQACDTLANNSDTALDQLSDAAAHAVVLFAKYNFARQPLVDPPVTAGSRAVVGDGHDHVEPVD